MFPTLHRSRVVGRFIDAHGNLLVDVRGGATATASFLDDLRSQRSTLDDTLAGGLAAQEYREGHVLTDEETAEFRRLLAEVEALDERIVAQEGIEARRARAAAASTHDPVVVRSEPMTYARGNGNRYFSDLALAHNPGNPNSEALARLNRHAAEMAVEIPARAARRDARAETELRSAYGDSSSFEKRTNPNRTDGTGGYFVPPVWLIDDYITLARAGRPVVNKLRQMDLPEGTDSINIPALLTGTGTGVQTADAASVTSTDFTDTFVNAPVRTIAGQQDVGLQLIEQSPHQIIDEVVLGDLTADYNRNCDRQSLNGTGASGQVLGLRAVSGINAITYTSASPLVSELVTPLGQSLSKIAQGTFDLSSTIFAMHPRRWFWIAVSLDGDNRPLVVPVNTGALSPLASSQLLAEGAVGNSWLGPQVIIDANIATTVAAGVIGGGAANQDEIFAIETNQTIWFEGNLRTRVLYEVLSGTLQVRFQVYNYVAQLTRRPTSISVISGTGTVGPSGF